MASIHVLRSTGGGIVSNGHDRTFVTEATLLRRLRGPRVPRVFGDGRSGDFLLNLYLPPSLSVLKAHPLSSTRAHRLRYSQ